MAKIIDGKHVSQLMRDQIKDETAKLTQQMKRQPKLVVIIVGENPASLSYIKRKEKDAISVGFLSETIALPENIDEHELLTIIQRLNDDATAHGILVQLPLPKHIDENKIIAAINPKKDVDGFHPVQVGRLSIGLESLQPCTPAGIMALLSYYDISVAGKHAVIVGRSNIVGKPMAALLLKNDATVTIVHSKTKNLLDLTSQADILIVAIGQPHFIKKTMLKQGAVVIDVGINRIENKLVGDVAFDEIKEKCAAITPVPGGVGPMTIAMLLHNTLQAYKYAIKKTP